ncbi:hypothetical protein [Acetivibrio ethanolgignens]|nr:hypothetical protein [Acetivibrio ethanolgignens]
MACNKFKCVYEIDGECEPMCVECTGDMCECFGECSGCKQQDWDECDGAM